MNLLENYEIEIATAMKNIFDTYKRKEPLLFYKASEEEITILDPDFNADLQEYNAVNTNLAEQSKPFYCRIIFPRRENSRKTSIPNISIPIKGDQDLGEIYIQMEEDAYLYVKDSIRFSFMGESYHKLSHVRKFGFLGTFLLYQIYLQKVN